MSACTGAVDEPHAENNSPRLDPRGGTLRARGAVGAPLLPRGREVETEEAELHAAIRRAELLLAAGGDPCRPLELYGRAVTALADDLDDPRAREQLAGGLAGLTEETAGLRGASEASGCFARTAISRGSATRWRSWPTLSPARTRREPGQTPTARMMLRSPLIVRTRSSPTGLPHRRAAYRRARAPSSSSR